MEKERQLCESLADQNNELLGRVKYLTESLEDQRIHLKMLSEQYQSTIAESSKSNESLASEYELKIMNLQDIVDSLRTEIINLNEEIAKYKAEAKNAKSQSTTKISEFQDRISTLESQMAAQETASNKSISEQRLMIDQLTNSMSEAAMQLMEAQSNDTVFKTDLDDRERKIESLQCNIDTLHEVIGDKDQQISKLRTEIIELNNLIAELRTDISNHVENESSLRADLNSKISESNTLFLKLKSSEIIANKLYKELDSLPVINKRLEADCKFLREDLKATSERLKRVVEDSETSMSRMGIIDSLLTTDQRIKLNERLNGAASRKQPSEASALAENKKLLVEAMELRMRLVDSQAARDKAQAQILEQSQLIARLQRTNSEGVMDLGTDRGENLGPNISRDVSPKKKSKKSSTAILTEEECRQQ
jgi:chromosome segregation ATPase